MKKRKIHESWPIVLYALAFCLGASLGQNSDCTGVDCPLLDNCIEEVLEDGACCASCAQRGCPCEGYQYYDCIRAGFKSGKVPEGASYLVDSGSTECRCPAGGGNISCRFIPCPEVPPNCIDLSETDTCPHCLRLGCVQGSLKYEAGHSFRMDLCQVCHCPNDGGDLMCSLIPDCSSETLTSTEQNELHLTRHEGHTGLQSRTDKIPANLLPLYTENSSEIDDYDYFPETTESPGVTTQPPLLTQVKTEAHDLYEDTREELKENKSVQETTDVQVVTTGAGPEPTPTENGVQQLPTSKPSQESLKNESEKPVDLEKFQTTVPELSTIPKMQTSPTTTAPTIRKDVQRKPPTLKRHHEGRDSKSEDHSVFSPQMIDSCCLDGERWASDHGHCNSMELSETESGSTCRSVQRQCCLSSWRDSRCSAGLNVARQGHDCGSEDEEAERCDSYRECCSCCALGLQMRARREVCDAPRGLGETCAHIVLSCCEGTDGSNHSAVTERGRPQTTSPPRKVPEGPDRQPFSLGELEDSENMVEEIEGLQDMDECRVYEGQLCEQRCVNTPGSYLCECFPNFVLQQDGIHCLPVTTDEENRLKENEVPTGDPNPSETISTPSEELLNPCEGNSSCAQHCSPVDGRPQCSCFPGFSLLADGRSCEDVDECLLSTHTCQPDEKCTNTDGHFTCNRAVVCPTGYREKNELCEDINECIMGTHDCAPGFDCINTAGAFSCRSRVRCPGGFSYDAQGQCTDVDECTTVTQPCSPGFNCINTYGSYTCQRKIIICGRGYHAGPDGSRCLDINECDTGVHRCGEDQLCQNLPGSYRCACRPGYQYDMFRRTCLDVNECWRYVGRLCAQTCENTPGSYQCSCSSGFTLSGDGKNCEDMNECSSSPCSQECANIYGSYQCYCKTGFYLGEDAHTCKDVDECSQSVGNLCAYKCVNVPGSYECACPENGYTMAPNGRSCSDVDECAMGSHNCTVDETCYNVQGGFRCLSFICPTNYRRVSDTRCERVSCSNFLECQNTPARITYYQLSFQINIMVPALIFRMGPSPAYTGDTIVISIADGNQDAYFSPRKLNAYTGAIYLQRQLPQPHDFLLDVEMKLWRQGAVTTFLARIYVFVTANLA